MHIPIVSYLDPENVVDRLNNREALLALFEGRRYTFSLAGHIHTTEHHYFGAEDGWKGAARFIS